MITNQIRPSDTRNWDVVKTDPKNHSQATKEMKNPEWYAYYKGDDDKWYPHRKPTISEIVNNKFK